LLFSKEPYFENIHYLLGNIILNGENVFQLTIIFFRPEMKAIRDVYQLHSGAKPRFDLLDAAFKDCGYAQLFSYFTNVLFLAFEEKDRSPCRDLEFAEIAQPGDNLIGYAVAKPAL